MNSDDQSTGILSQVNFGRFKFRYDTKSPGAMYLFLDGLLDGLFESHALIQKDADVLSNKLI